MDMPNKIILLFEVAVSREPKDYVWFYGALSFLMMGTEIV